MSHPTRSLKMSVNRLQIVCCLNGLYYFLHDRVLILSNSQLTWALSQPALVLGPLVTFYSYTFLNMRPKHEFLYQCLWLNIRKIIIAWNFSFEQLKCVLTKLVQENLKYFDFAQKPTVLVHIAYNLVYAYYRYYFYSWRSVPFLFSFYQ